jgi:hypothetical protein
MFVITSIWRWNVFEDSRAFLEFLPKELDECFTNKVLALKLGASVRLAQSAFLKQNLVTES